MSELSAMEQYWDSAQVQETASMDDIPEGKYVCRVEACRFTKTKETNKPMIAWELVIQDNANWAGRKLFLNRVLDIERPSSFEFAKTDFARIGLEKEAQTANTLKQALEKAINMRINVVVKRSSKDGKDYLNIYINSAAKEIFPDDDIPF